MKTFRYVALMAVLAVAASGCARKGDSRVVQWTPLEPQPVGSVAGDTIETIPAVIGEKAVTVISAVRTFEREGLLAVCAAGVIAAPRAQISDVVAYFGDRSSELVIGPTVARAVRMSPSFMRVHTRELASGMLDPKGVDFTKLEGDCVLTTLPWSAEYRSANRLDLRKTVYTSSGYTYTYIPRKR